VGKTDSFCKLAKKDVSRHGATCFAHGGKAGKTPLEPAVQDSLFHDMQSNSKVRQKE